MNKIYKISSWSFLSPLLFPIFLFLILILYGYFLPYLYFEIIVIVSIGMLLVIPLIMTLLLHFNYFYIDNGKILEIDTDSQGIRISQNNKIYSFKMQDIDRVRMINSNNYDDYYSRPMPWGSHYYYMICLKNDEEYIVTRLTVRKLEKILNVRIVYKRVFFPYITKNVLNKAINN